MAVNHARLHLSRRQLVQGAGALGLGLLAACGALPGQQAPPRIYRIGYLSPQSLAAAGPRFEAFQKGLRELGWIEGQNFTLERRLADGQAERLPDLAAELVRLQTDVVVTTGDPAARAMAKA